MYWFRYSCASSSYSEYHHGLPVELGLRAAEVMRFVWASGEPVPGRGICDTLCTQHKITYTTVIGTLDRLVRPPQGLCSYSCTISCKWLQRVIAKAVSPLEGRWLHAITTFTLLFPWMNRWKIARLDMFRRAMSLRSEVRTLCAPALRMGTEGGSKVTSEKGQSSIVRPCLYTPTAQSSKGQRCAPRPGCCPLPAPFVTTRLPRRTHRVGVELDCWPCSGGHGALSV